MLGKHRRVRESKSFKNVIRVALRENYGEIGKALVNLHSTARIVGAANTLGYACIGVSDESMMERACQVAQNMPTYPATGSVYDAGEFVVVKLSE